MVYSNLNNLFNQTRGLQNAEFTLIKFSNDYHIYKGIFGKNKASLVKNITEKPQMTLNLRDIFYQHYGSVTNFTSELAGVLATLLKNKYNVLIFSDSDVIAGENFDALMSLFKVQGGKLFVVFDSRDTYIRFRQNAKMSTPNISFFKE